MEEMLDLERVRDIGDTLSVCVVLTQWQQRRKIVSTIDHATTFLGYDVMPPVQGADDRVVSDGIIAPCGRYGGLLDIDFYLTLEIVSHHFLAKPNLTAINTKQLSQWRFIVRKSFYCNVLVGVACGCWKKICVRWDCVVTICSRHYCMKVRGQSGMKSALTMTYHGEEKVSCVFTSN